MGSLDSQLFADVCALIAEGVGSLSLDEKLAGA